MTAINCNSTTRDSQAKRLDTTVWTRANPYMGTVMRALREKRGDSFTLNKAGKDYDKFVWWNVEESGNLYVPLAHFRSVKPSVAAQMRRMGFGRDYVEAYLDYEGPAVVGADLRNVVEQRFWGSLNASTGGADE